MSVILLLGRLRKEDCKFKASLGYRAKLCPKKKKKKKKVLKVIIYQILTN
jgi:hypothetical protein